MVSTLTPTSSISSRGLQRIRARGRGSVFVPTDFLDLGSREAVDAMLGRLRDSGTLRRIGRGVYDFPRVHPRFGLRAPSVDAVARAIARSTQETIHHGGAMAANLLGVSTQVPAQAVYVTDGTSRVFKVDLGDGRGFDIHFRRSTRRAGGDTRAGLVLRALRFLGQDGVDGTTIRRLRACLSDSDLRALTRLRPRATAWMRSIIDDVVQFDMTGNSPKAE
jgi:uncharacterized protein DUF6088